MATPEQEIRTTRRAVVRGAAWAAPVALATVAAPAVAASQPPAQYEMGLGIFVSASTSADAVWRVGYSGGNAGGVQAAAGPLRNRSAAERPGRSPT